MNNVFNSDFDSISKEDQAQILTSKLAELQLKNDDEKRFSQVYSNITSMITDSQQNLFLIFSKSSLSETNNSETISNGVCNHDISISILASTSETVVSAVSSVLSSTDYSFCDLVQHMTNTSVSITLGALHAYYVDSDSEVAFREGDSSIQCSEAKDQDKLICHATSFSIPASVCDMVTKTTVYDTQVVTVDAASLTAEVGLVGVCAALNNKAVSDATKSTLVVSVLTDQHLHALHRTLPCPDSTYVCVALPFFSSATASTPMFIAEVLFKVADNTVSAVEAITSTLVKALAPVLPPLTSFLSVSHTLRNSAYSTELSKAIHFVTDILTGNIGSPYIVSRLMKAAYSLVQAERISLFLVEEAGVADHGKTLTHTQTETATTGNQSSKRLVCVVSADDKMLLKKFCWGEGLVGLAAESQSIVNVRDPYLHPHFSPDADHDTGFVTRNVLAVPVLDSEGHTIAVLQAINKIDLRCGTGAFFTPVDERSLKLLASTAGIALRKSQLYYESVRSEKKSEALLSLLRMPVDGSLDDVLTHIASVTYSALNADRVSIYFVDKGYLFQVVSRNRHNWRIPLGQGIAGHVGLTGTPLNIPDAYADDRFDRSFDERTGYRTRSILCMPIIDGDTANASGSNDGVIAVIQVINKRRGDNLRDDAVASSPVSFTTPSPSLSPVNSINRCPSMSASEKPESVSTHKDKTMSAVSESFHTAEHSLFDSKLDVLAFDDQDVEILEAICAQLVATIRRYMAQAIVQCISTGRGLTHTDNQDSSDNGYIEGDEDQDTVNEDDYEYASVSSLLGLYTRHHEAFNDNHTPSLPTSFSSSFHVPITTQATSPTSAALLTPIASASMEEFSDLKSRSRSSSSSNNVSHLNKLQKVPSIIMNDEDGNNGFFWANSISIVRNKRSGGLLVTRKSPLSSTSNKHVNAANKISAHSLSVNSPPVAPVELNKSDSVLSVENLIVADHAGTDDSTRLRVNVISSNPSENLACSGLPCSASSPASSLSSFGQQSPSVLHVHTNGLPPSIRPSMPQVSHCTSQFPATVLQCYSPFMLALPLSFNLAWPVSMLANETSQTVVNKDDTHEDSSTVVSPKNTSKGVFFKPIPSKLYTLYSPFSSPEVGALLAPEALVSLSFDPFSFSEMDLIIATYNTLVYTGALNVFKCSYSQLQSFVMFVAGMYRDNPFHNFRHGFSVFQFAYVMLTASATDANDAFNSNNWLLNPLEACCILIASLGHDLDHPGNTNSFEILTQSPLALMHNDIAVLENHHAETLGLIMRQPQCALLSNLDRSKQNEARKLINKAILSTDMEDHMDTTHRIGSIPQVSDLDLTKPANRQLLANVIIHTADLSGQLYDLTVALEWERRISEEFGRQSCAETRLGHTPLPFMSNLDRSHTRCKGQIGFISFVLTPWWRYIVKWFPNLTQCVTNLDNNRAHYERAVAWFEANNMSTVSCLSSREACDAADGCIHGGEWVNFVVPPCTNVLYTNLNPQQRVVVAEDDSALSALKSMYKCEDGLINNHQRLNFDGTPFVTEIDSSVTERTRVWRCGLTLPSIPEKLE